MKLSFVIPAYNEERSIGRCLDSIEAQTRGKKIDVEIVVVDNASIDGTRAVAERHRGVRVIDESRKGIVWARRAGFLASTGDLIANVDADTMLTPGWIEKVFAAFSRDPKLLALSGPVVYYDLSLLTRFFVKIFYAVGYATYFINHYVFRAGAMLQGGNYVARRSALEAIGGYDTRIQFYGEDTDIARRIGRIGKVKFTFDLPIYASGRRLAGEGVVMTGARYALNYFWTLVFKRPFTMDSADIRRSSAVNPHHEHHP